MCGRYGFVPDKDFYDRFEITNRDAEVVPNYNISPGGNISVITANSPKRIEKMKWGLIPFWAKDPRIKYSTINARAEEIETKPAFRKPFKNQRCLVPASGFFEWRRVTDSGKIRKIPYWIRLKDEENFVMAGIYDVWKDVQGYEIKSFAIITTEANSLMREIHERMPVILEKNTEDVWVDNQISDVALLKRLLVSYQSENMEIWRVSDWVNNPINNSKQVIERIDE